MKLSSAIREDYCRSLDSIKDRRKKGIAQQERDSRESDREHTTEKGLVDGRQIKQSRVEITRHFVCLKDIQTIKMMSK